LGAEAFGGDDVGGGAAGFKHGGENFFGDGTGDFGRFDELHQFGEGSGRDGAGGISLPDSLRPRRSSVCIQLAAALPGAPALTTDSKKSRGLGCW